jgi:hypothetical protein
MQPIVRLSAIAAAIAATLAVAGCAEPPPPVIPTSQPSTAPVFATDADALAAAKSAYEAYLSVSDAVDGEGGQNPSRFAAVVSTSWLPKEIASASSLVKSQRRQIGSSRVEQVRLQQLSQTAELVRVGIYACLDLSGVHFVDVATGLEPSDPITALVPVQVELRSASTTHLLVERNSPWQGKDFCQ